MPHDIIDNREVKLSAKVGLMLDNASRVKFAVKVINHYGDEVMRVNKV